MEEQDEEDMQLRKDFSHGGLSWMRPSGIVSELPTGRQNNLENLLQKNVNHGVSPQKNNIEILD